MNELINRILDEYAERQGEIMAVDEIRLYKLQEVAEILKVSRQTIYNYVTAKKLKATKYGKEYRVTEADLKEFIEQGHN